MSESAKCVQVFGTNDDVTMGTDSDDDGIPDELDAFPFDPAASVDTDGDGMPDQWNLGYFAEDSTSSPRLVKDDDDDNDLVPDVDDQLPLDTSEIYDFDGDGLGDNQDPDDDDDGYEDLVDAFPFNPLDWTDTDNDGVGDNTDAFGLDASLQSLTIDEALGAVTDPTLRECLSQATADLQRAGQLVFLYCGFDEDKAPVHGLEGIEHFFNLEHPTRPRCTGKLSAIG